MFRTDCTFSPRDELCVTGVSAGRGETGVGQLIFLDRTTFKPAYQIDYPNVVGLNFISNLSRRTVFLYFRV